MGRGEEKREEGIKETVWICFVVVGGEGKVLCLERVEGRISVGWDKRVREIVTVK